MAGRAAPTQFHTTNGGAIHEPSARRGLPVPARPGADRRGHGGARLGSGQARADGRPVELLHRSARSRARWPHRQVLPLAHVRLPRRDDAGRPALAGRRAREPLGELVRLQAVDLPPPKGRQVPQRRRRDLGGREVQSPAGHRQALDHRLRGAAAHPDPGHRDAGSRPGGDRHQRGDPDHPDLSLALPLHRGHGPAQEVHRGQRRRRLRPQAGRQRPVQVRRAGHRLAHPADRGRQSLADRDAQVQEHPVPAGARGDDPHRAAAPG